MGLISSEFKNEEVQNPKCVRFDTFKERTINSIEIQVTNNCNLECSYCFQKTKYTDKLSLKDYYQIIDLLFNDIDMNNFEKFTISDKCRRGYFLLYFIGGEPLLEIENIKKCVEYFEKKLISHNMVNLNWKIETVTNGTLLFTDKVQEFINKYRDRLWMLVSMDGYMEKSHDICRCFPNGMGTFKLARKALKYVDSNFKRENDYIAKMKYIVSKNNLQYLYEDAIGFLKDGYMYINSGLVVEDDWNIDDSKSYYYQLKMVADYMIKNKLYKNQDFSPISKFAKIDYFIQENEYNKEFRRCSIFDTRKLSISADKNIIACFSLDKSSLGDDELSYGNIYDGECITDEQLNTFNMLYNHSIENDYSYKCRYCPILKRCTGCPAVNYLRNRTFELCETACHMYEAEYLANLYYINKLSCIGFIDNPQKNRLSIERCMNIICMDEYNMIEELYKEALRYHNEKPN